MAILKNVKLKAVGVTFVNEDGTSRQDIIGRLDEHAVIFLVREPENKFDKNAVKVVTLFGQVGYIGRDYAEILAEMMDGGRKFSATVAEVDEYKGTNYLHVLVNEVEQ
jgi:hypothetical protein